MAGRGPMRAAPSPERATMNGTEKNDKAADFANYFCTYAFLYHQKEMLSDRVRMEAYYNSVFKNAHHFQGKVVLDVGTGSGILAIWAAQAGARRVYAVEYTDMAKHAAKLVAANKMDHIVEVIQGSVEEIDLPEKVDIIISEWMGYFLLRESMLDSVLVARDKWLKPGGAMYPSHARMWLAPIKSGMGEHKMQDYEASMNDWVHFTQNTRHAFGVDMSTLSNSYREEQVKYFLQTSLWQSLYPSQVVGQPALVKEIDCLTVTLDDVKAVSANFQLPVFDGETRVSGFAGWFDVRFQGSPSQAADETVELTTAPSINDTTHWGQQVFLLHPPLHVRDNDVVHGSILMTRSKTNHRLMDVVIKHAIGKGAETASAFHIE
ncbi:protein arginine methyltransferase [Klebsormidium nitens]|uniref:Protein arginine N-methyltransferase PRMT10 n=1 Tax=Klebsormidium nitens TaxID=105231 RepID=A0A1Y1HRH8_KLENI|nr:protein arginine methyltransferase [Klebsormidium nitens]|eukprot:GAQ79601.1 protein arginine methyltransferase [Klebsormidium nitens]